MLIAPPQRQPGVHAPAAAGAGPGLERSRRTARRARACRSGRARGRRRPGCGRRRRRTSSSSAPSATATVTTALARPRVLDDVAQRLLHDPVGRGLDDRRARGGSPRRCSSTRRSSSAGAPRARRGPPAAAAGRSSAGWPGARISPIVSRVSLSARDASSSISRAPPPCARGRARRAGGRRAACSAIPASAWPTTSWRSRAMRTRSWATASRVSIPRRASSSRLRSLSVRRTSPMIVARTASDHVVISCTPAPGSPCSATAVERRPRRRTSPGEDRAAPVGQVRRRGGREHRAQPAGGDRVAEQRRQHDPRRSASRTANGALRRRAIGAVERTAEADREGVGVVVDARALRRAGERGLRGRRRRSRRPRAAGPPRVGRSSSCPERRAPAADRHLRLRGARTLLAVDGARRAAAHALACSLRSSAAPPATRNA